MLGEGIGEYKEEENGSFMLMDVFVACNTRPGEFGSLGRSDLAQIFLFP